MGNRVQFLILLIILLITGCTKYNFSGWEDNGMEITSLNNRTIRIPGDVIVNGSVTAAFFYGNISNTTGSLISNISSIWNSSGNIIYANDSTSGLKIKNIYDVDGSNFFELSCTTSQTPTAMDSMGTVTCEQISITESQISDLDHYTDADIGGDEAAFDGWDKNSNDDMDASNFSTSKYINITIIDGSMVFLINISQALCIELTGSADLCDGNDAIGSGGNNSPWNSSSDGIYPSDINANVGIGTNTPTESITIAGNGSITGDLRVEGNLLGDSGIGGSSTLLSGWTDDGDVVRLTTSGDKVGIGITNPSEKLEVNGNIKNNGSINATGNIYSGGDLIAS